ncbi:MAG TPA: cob(I)yrinic acid a,c-diamide adenosyltransferase [Saprospiraceae bacterium]|nr:cob(I)yrinic acid a,c-diamide adenosyltransferase [Saprospiraceae bacterium]
MAFKIYTKTGDAGETGLYGGTRLPKHHIRIETYGTVDELNAYVGYLCESVADTGVRELLIKIQNNLFTIGGMLALDPSKSLKVPLIVQGDITRLEIAIDAMEEDLPPIKQFILPSGHHIGSLAHIVRTVCRRAERAVVALHAQEPVDPLVLQYLNRLADYFFVMARYLNMLAGATERPWEQP